MSSYIRPRAPGSTIYFEVALRDRGSTLLTDQINLLRFSVAQTLKDWPVEVEAWTVLPDRMHCIWRLPEGDCDYSTRWRLIKSRFSRALPLGPRRPSDLKRGERGIWQRRFWEHHMRGPFDYAAHMQLCWMAPVRAGLVEKARDWEYSSFAKAKREGRKVRAPARTLPQLSILSAEMKAS